MLEDRLTRVLIVEDEALIRMLGCDVLEGAGFEVLDAANADEAVILLEQHSVHLVFSDVDMPGSMDGLELAALVHRRWPTIGLLITSGHRKADDGSIPDAGRFIPKPWRDHDVIDRIRMILADKRAGK